MLQNSKGRSQEWYRMCWNSWNRVRCQLMTPGHTAEGRGITSSAGPSGGGGELCVVRWVPHRVPQEGVVYLPCNPIQPLLTSCVSRCRLRDWVSLHLTRFQKFKPLIWWKPGKKTRAKGLEEETCGQGGSRIPSIPCVHAQLENVQVKKLWLSPFPLTPNWAFHPTSRLMWHLGWAGGPLQVSWQVRSSQDPSSPRWWHLCPRGQAQRAGLGSPPGPQRCSPAWSAHHGPACQCWDAGFRHPRESWGSSSPHFAVMSPCPRPELR